MPRGLVRYHHTGHFHFLTFSCYRRQPLLAARSGYGIFEQELEKVRQRHRFFVAGYVVMPEHVHMLVSEPRSVLLSVVLQVLKQQVSRKLKRPGDIRFWQRRYYDFNVWNHDKTIEKLKYMHRNPVRRGLAEKPQDWPWSSFRHYLTGDLGAVEIESTWTSWRREHPSASVPPTLPKTGEG
jgi:putative transposase